MHKNNNKAIRVENKRLLALNAKLAGTNQSISLQLKQQEDDLTRRRREVATLHQACAKYKRAQLVVVFAQRLRNLTVTARPAASASTTPLPTATRQTTSTSNPIKARPTISVASHSVTSEQQQDQQEPFAESTPSKEDACSPCQCSRCQQMQRALDEIGKRSQNISRLLDAESERIRTSFDEEMELSRKRAAESTARSQRSCQEAKEHLNRIRDEARRRFAEIAQQDFSVHARRLRNGFADAG